MRGTGSNDCAFDEVFVHDAAGVNAMQPSGALQRCWRDVHTLTQHVILGTGRFEIVGRIMFGLPPGSPII